MKQSDVSRSRINIINIINRSWSVYAQKHFIYWLRMMNCSLSGVVNMWTTTCQVIFHYTEPQPTHSTSPCAPDNSPPFTPPWTTDNTSSQRRHTQLLLRSKNTYNMWSKNLHLRATTAPPRKAAPPLHRLPTGSYCASRVNLLLLPFITNGHSRQRAASIAQIQLLSTM